MMLSMLDRRLLVDRGQKISVSIIDSGFSKIPSYATMHGRNPMPGHVHGNRVLSIFTAPDALYSIAGLELHLACHAPNGGYASLERALSLLPRTDILSISLSWGDDIPELRSLLLSKADMIFVPFTSGTRLPYPSAYDGMMTCSDHDDRLAKYCAKPVPEWNGLSYSVPAIARLAVHSPALLDVNAAGSTPDDPIQLQEVFSPASGSMQVSRTRQSGATFTCGSCKRTLRNPDHSLMTERPSRCPYCGMTP